jgi:hypothetical protein
LVGAARAKGGQMGEMVGSDEMSMVRGDRDDGEYSQERFFTVGEVVEVWEGAFVRGYRQAPAPGEPAFVKRVEGNGFYSIKMVGSSRGKFRVVRWQNLFREGSFGKNVCRTDSGRVRVEARLKARAHEEAEVRFRRELRQTKHELDKAEKTQQDVAKHGEMRLKVQEKTARQAVHDLIAGHKRQLDAMRGAMESKRDKEVQERDDACRQGRLKTRQVVRELEKAQTDLTEARVEKDELVKALKKGTGKFAVVLKEGLAWEGKHADLQGKIADRERALTSLERHVVVVTRELGVLQRRHDDMEGHLAKRNTVIAKHEEVSRLVRAKQDEKSRESRFERQALGQQASKAMQSQQVS